MVQSAVQAVKRLYESAGPVREATSLRGLTPRERANVAWARLRRAEVDPVKVLETWLTIELAVAADPDPPKGKEFQLVQAAKRVHQLASGTHKSWPPITFTDPSNPFLVLSVPQELHAYPHSRGRVLRHLGGDIKKATEALTYLMRRDLGVDAPPAPQAATPAQHDSRPGGPPPEDITAALEFIARRGRQQPKETT